MLEAFFIRNSIQIVNFIRLDLSLRLLVLLHEDKIGKSNFVSLVGVFELMLQCTRARLAWPTNQPNGVMLIPHINFRANIALLGKLFARPKKRTFESHSHEGTHLFFFAQLLYCIRANNSNFRWKNTGHHVDECERQVDSILFK